MSADGTALRFLRAAVAAQSHKNGSFEPLLWNCAIVAMRISTGAPRRSRGRCKGLGQFRPKTLHLSKAGNLESLGFQGFRLCSVRIKIRYFILVLDKKLSKLFIKNQYDWKRRSPHKLPGFPGAPGPAPVGAIILRLRGSPSSTAPAGSAGGRPSPPGEAPPRRGTAPPRLSGRWW